MRTSRGFTLIELAIVVAVVGILAALAGSYMRAERRNAGIAAAASGLHMRIEQLQYVALSEQVDQLLVIADVRDNKASNCGTILSEGCARVFHLRAPAADWKLVDFDVTKPGQKVAAIVDEERLGQSVKFHLDGKGAAVPKPFDVYGTKLQVFDPDLLANCKDSRQCVAYRFRADGEVALEYPDPSSASTTEKAGHAFALASELTGEYQGARQLGVLVAVPSGIVRTFAVP